MKYLEEKCPRCKKALVIPPLKIELEKDIILVKCGGCKKSSRYNVVSHFDKPNGYKLSKWGRNKVPDGVRKIPACVSWSADQEAKTKAAGETKQSLLEYAYRVRVLGIDN